MSRCLVKLWQSEVILLARTDPRGPVSNLVAQVISRSCRCAIAQSFRDRGKQSDELSGDRILSYLSGEGFAYAIAVIKSCRSRPCKQPASGLLSIAVIYDPPISVAYGRRADPRAKILNAHFSAEAAIGGMRRGRRLHCTVLPLDAARQIERGREIRAAAYRKSLLTLSTRSGSRRVRRAVIQSPLPACASFTTIIRPPTTAMLRRRRQ